MKRRDSSREENQTRFLIIHRIQMYKKHQNQLKIQRDKKQIEINTEYRQTNLLNRNDKESQSPTTSPRHHQNFSDSPTFGFHFMNLPSCHLPQYSNFNSQKLIIYVSGNFVFNCSAQKLIRVYENIRD
jgi:hypothetical protein